MQSFNILLYGVGSKIEILNDFQEYLSELSYSFIRMNAYNPMSTVRKILLEIAKLLGDEERKSTSVDILLASVQRGLGAIDFDIFLMVDSIDSATINDPGSQLLLSSIASQPRVHLIASLDNAYLLYRWSLDANIKFNFLYFQCATMAPYTTELSFTDGLKVFDYSSTHSQLRGIEYVLKSLTNTQKNILKELAYVQIKDSGGITFKEFLNKCIEETLVTNAKQLKDYLVEAIDHQIVAYKVGQRGENVIYLKADPVFLTNNIP